MIQRSFVNHRDNSFLLIAALALGAAACSSTTAASAPADEASTADADGAGAPIIIGSPTKDAYGYKVTPWEGPVGEEGYILVAIDAKGEQLAAIGWNTLSGVISTRPDNELDLKKIKTLLTRVKSQIHKASGRVAYTMNEQLDEAREACDAAVASGWNSGLAYNNRGAFHIAMGDYEAAIRDFQTAIDAHGADRLAERNLQRAQVRLSQHRELATPGYVVAKTTEGNAP